MMRKLFSFIAIALLFAGSVDAQKARAYTLDNGLTSYVDTLTFSQGKGVYSDTTDSKVDTMLGANDKDTTTTRIPLANLETLALMVNLRTAQGTAGGTSVFNCTLQVAMTDSADDWVSVTPVFATASSANRNFYQVYLSPSTVDSTAGSEIAAARFGRFIISHVNGAADTSFTTAVMHRTYKRR